MHATEGWYSAPMASPGNTPFDADKPQSEYKGRLDKSFVLHDVLESSQQSCPPDDRDLPCNHGGSAPSRTLHGKGSLTLGPKVMRMAIHENASTSKWLPSMKTDSVHLF